MNNSNVERVRKFSIVIAVFNEGIGLYKLIERINSSLKEYEGEIEIILVDDRSLDNSWDVLIDITKKFDYIKALRFCRNFGQHSALTAGLKYASGQYIVLMDCDLQDEPEHILPMYQKLIDEKKHIIYAKRKTRKFNYIRVKLSNFFYSIVTFLSGIQMDSEIGTFRIMTKKVVESYNCLPEKRRYVGALFYWMGYDYSTYDVIHAERQQGKSNYNFQKLIKLAKLAVLSFSTRLLSFGIYLGLGSTVLSAFATIYFLIMRFLYESVISGFTATIVSIYFIGGMILVVLGIIGEYLGELFLEVKGRPNYIIEDSINL